ncbi:MAG: aldehyde dehydrogenase family protein, partial [Dietzia sp.]
MTGTLSRDTDSTTHVDERLGAEARDFLARPHRLLIGGQWVDAADGRTFATHDPATGAEITRVAHGGPEDVDRAVAAARRTFDDGAWATMKPREREQILWRIGDLLDAKAELFGQIEALDNGKSVAIATAVDVAWAADVFRYYAGWA